MKDFFCPICESKLDFERIAPTMPGYFCKCSECGLNTEGRNQADSYFNFINAIPAQFFLEKIADKLDALDSNVMNISDRLAQFNKEAE